MNDLDYLMSIVPQKLDWTKNITVMDHPEMTSEQWTKEWLTWMWNNHFAYVLKDRSGYILWRPVTLQWIFDAGLDYFQTIQWFDWSGDAVWIDSLWAPGNYSKVLDLLRATKKTFVGWNHKKIIVKRIDGLSGDKPILSQIRLTSSDPHPVSPD